MHAIGCADTTTRTERGERFVGSSQGAKESLCSTISEGKVWGGVGWSRHPPLVLLRSADPLPPS